MGFKTLTNFFSVVASKLMGLSTPANFNAFTSVDGKDIATGDNGFFETAWVIFKTAIGDTLMVAYETLVRLFYAIGHWVLTLIDFIFVFVRQLVGMNTNFDSLEEITQGDIIFQFLFNENVIKIIRNILIFSIVLLIIFCIFAIVKSEYQFVTNQGGNSKKGILVSALRSLFLMAFVPLVIIGSIIMSNAILRSLYLVTSSGNSSFSMGTQIFVASTYEANAYRRYANRNLKIPITFNFNEINSSDNISGYYTDGTVAEMDEALKAFRSQSVWTRGYKTFLMFSSNGFLNMREVDALDKQYLSENKTSPYHAAYDEGIHTRSEQYYVMADVVEYAMKNNVAIYFKTLQEVYESYYSVDPQVHLKSDGIMPIGKDKDDYYVNVRYDGDTASTTYKHICDETDEAKGATFVIALEREITVNVGTEKEPKEVSYRYYYPLMNGLDNFATDHYSGTRNVVIARGMFEDGKNPTAIKENDGVVEFYRDDMNIPMLADFFPKISYELPAGSTESLGLKILKGALSYLTGVDVSQFIPYVYISVDVFHLFTKTSNTIVDLDNGRMKIDYNFTSKEFDKANVYKLSDFNLVIFVLACGILSSLLIKILFGLVFRTLDVVTLAITYPAVLATMPLDNGEKFQEWCKKFTAKILPVYAIVVAINVVLMLAPIAWEVELFTVADIQYGIAMGELGSFVTAYFLNMFTHFLFVMVAFSSIEPFVLALGDFLGTTVEAKGDKPAKYPVIDDGKMVLNDLKALPNRVGNVVSGRFILDAVAPEDGNGNRHFLPGAAGWIPGGALIGGEIQHAFEPYNKMQERLNRNKEIAANKQAVNDLVNQYSSSSGSGGGSGGTASSARASSASNSNSETSSSENSGAGNAAAAISAASAGDGSANASLEAAAENSDKSGNSPQNISEEASTNGEEGSANNESMNNSGIMDRIMGENTQTENASNSGSTQTAPQMADETSEAVASEHEPDPIEQGLDVVANAIPVRGVGTGMLSLAAKTVAKTTKFAYKTTKTAVKLAGKMALATGKLALGLTKTALKMAGRVVKTTAKAVYAYGTGQQGGIKTLNQIIFNAGVGTAVIGASQITKTGFSFGKDVVKASASTTGSVLKNFGSAYFGKTKQSGRVQPAVQESAQSEQNLTQRDRFGSSEQRTETGDDAQDTDLREKSGTGRSNEEGFEQDEPAGSSDDGNAEGGSQENSDGSDKTKQSSDKTGDANISEGADQSAEKGSGTSMPTSETGKQPAGDSSESSDSGESSKQAKKVTIHVEGSPSDYEAEVSKQKGKDSIIARRKTSHKNSTNKDKK